MESVGKTSQLKEIIKNLGFRNDQLRSDDYFHNAGWYVQSGEKIGFGDLSKDDLLALSKFATEPILILHERDSFWTFVKTPGLTGAMADVDRETEQNPGSDYVLKKCAAIVIPKRGNKEGILYRVNGFSDQEEVLKNGLKCVFIPQKKITEALQEFTAEA